MNRKNNLAVDLKNNFTNMMNDIDVQVEALKELLNKLYGEKYVNEALKKLNLKKHYKSDKVEEKIYALQRLVLKKR
ncbi:hypothetical protein TCEA9_09330 [Thermobrachium celere]|nr:hypothetical protein TCEA9_09330 [Thermobrachium celere]